MKDGYFKVMQSQVKWNAHESKVVNYNELALTLFLHSLKVSGNEFQRKKRVNTCSLTTSPCLLVCLLLTNSVALWKFNAPVCSES